MTDDPDIRIATSLMDYLFRKLAVMYLGYEERVALGILATDERLGPTLPGVIEQVTRRRRGPISRRIRLRFRRRRLWWRNSSSALTMRRPNRSQESVRQLRCVLLGSAEAPFCMTCGVSMQRRCVFRLRRLWFVERL